jgi:HlyD family secretion protein
MFDLEPDTARIVRAEIVESDIPNVAIGQEVEITPENDPDQVYVGRVLRRATMFGARQLQSDTPTLQTDERVVEVVVSADDAPLLIGQRVLVKFMRPGETAGAEREAVRGVGPDQAMRTPERRG